MNTSAAAELLTNLRREARLERLLPNLTAGLVVGLLCSAVSVSLGALIYSAELVEFLPRGVGFALLSSLVVSLSVALFSSLPGVTAVVQDAPAAILAVAAAGIVAAIPPGTGLEAAFMTVVATSAVTTLAVAVMFLLVGTFRWGRLVRYLPYPVVGGFLGGTGWLLVAGGVGVMADVPVTWSSLPDLFLGETWLRWIPGLALALVLLAVTARLKHYLVWPATLLGALALFYLLMLVTGAAPDDWRARGLLLGPFPEMRLLAPLDYGTLTEVNWVLVATHASTAATVVFVSLMAVLLYATGIEVATGKNADVNRELRVAGIGNLIAGAAGGVPGYHAVSLTMLNYRLGTGSRTAPLSAALVLVAALLFGASVLSYVPPMIVGGLLVFLGLVLLIEWVYGAYFKLPALEYGIIVVIVLVIATVGFLHGVAVGIFAAVALFVVNYSRSEVVRHAFSGAVARSRVRRGQTERRRLAERADSLLVLQLQGYVFFGTANALLERIEPRLDRSPSPEFVVLDFRRVTGVDATALLAFEKLAQLAGAKGFTLVLTELSPAIARQLEHGGVVGTAGERVRVFASLDEALEWCEEEVLAEASSKTQSGPSLELRLASLAGTDFKPSRLLAYFERLEVAAGQYLMRQGDAPDVLYFVESGQITARLEAQGQPPVRLETMRGGSVVGEIGFYSGEARTASVVADEPGTVYKLTRQALDRMAQEDPALAADFHRLIVRLLADRVVHLMGAVDALER